MSRVGMLFILFLLTACPPAPNPPQPDSGDASSPPSSDAGPTCADACKAMAFAGCSEGLVADCALVCAHVKDAALTALDVACLAKAATKDAVRRCGVACK